MKTENISSNPATELYPNRYVPIVPNGRHCEITGLSHGRLFQLLNGPAREHVRVASLREPAKKRGKRLFHVGDMLKYLDALAAAGRSSDKEAA